MRTVIGVAVLTFYSVLLLAGGQDIWAQKLDVGLSSVLWTFRILLVVLPVLLGWLSWKLCRDLQAGHHSEHEADLAETRPSHRTRPCTAPGHPDRARGHRPGVTSGQAVRSRSSRASAKTGGTPAMPSSAASSIDSTGPRIAPSAIREWGGSGRRCPR